MTEPKPYPTAPVELPLRLEPDPEPTAGCDVCLALDSQRTEARMRGDLSKVSDLNVEIRRHAHGS
ncbi:hypothetical protein [Streptomyces prunicolor]|uniref:hypothetical protein n=1 Tax=Streptomyces prunicolor TaxID=67348 RepID=UPI0009974435|nr:hypothetical protein [Streptomyces prunicolor]